MTLVEVVASLAILGSMMVAVLLAQSRLTRQYQLADQKINAIHLADELLQGWTESKEGIPRNSQGNWSSSSYSWRTSTVAVDVFHPVQVEKTIVQVYHPSGSLLHDASQILLCEVEVLRHPADKENTLLSGSLP